MDLIFYVTFLLVASISKANHIGMHREEEGESGDSSNGDDVIAFESLGTPVFAPSINSVRLNGKSAYNIPAPASPANYAAYLTSLGLGNPYSYSLDSRFNTLPYGFPPAYGTPALMPPGFGYERYGSLYFDQSRYPGLGYPGYPSTLGYRYGELGNVAGIFRRGPAPVVGIAPEVPRAISPVVAAVPAPLPIISNAIPGLPAPEPVVLPYRTPFRAVRGKDGIVRYAYATDGQNLPTF